jgi:hypothetical protein
MPELPPILGQSASSVETGTEIHSWEGKEKDVLVLNYTMACPLSCDFCCYGCHPGRKEKMPIELALSLVEQAADISTFSSVGFTGGEPMLFFDEILTIGKRLNHLRLPFTIVSACHWASSEDEAFKHLETLAAVGLCRFNCSYDPSHACFVPASFVTNAATAASRLGIPTYVVGTFYSAKEKLETYLPELRDVPGITLHNKYAAKVGRAAKRNITQQSYELNLNLDDLCCYRAIHHDIVIFFDGMAYPCCSTFNRATPGIAVGNAFKDSLREIWQRVEGSLMLRTMKRHGFARLYEIIREYDSELYQRLPAVESAVGPCSLCNGIFKEARISTRVHDVFRRYEEETISGVLDLVSERCGPQAVTNLLTQFLDTSDSATENNRGGSNG